MSKLRRLALLFALSLPAAADPLPTYSYFYVCSDYGTLCTDANDNRFYGDFGFSGRYPIAGVESAYIDFAVTDSNARGEVVGNAQYPDFWRGAGYAPSGDPNIIMNFGEDSQVQNINDRGFHVYRYGNQWTIRSHGSGQSLVLDRIDSFAFNSQFGVFPRFGFARVSFVEWINESNQLLASLTFLNDQSNHRMLLSPTPIQPIPEPASAFLLGAGAICLAATRRASLSSR